MPFHGEGFRTKKAPEGGCSPGKKGLTILYLFALVGRVPDLNCNCSIAALFSGSDNNGNVHPVRVDLQIIVGILDISNLFGNQRNKICHITSSLIIRPYGNSQILLRGIKTGLSVESINLTVKAKMTKGLRICLNSCIQKIPGLYIQLGIVVLKFTLLDQICSFRLAAESLQDLFSLPRRRGFAGCGST